jgi:hypothetical protein
MHTTHHAKARRTDPRTSHEAAQAVTPSLTAVQRRVMRYAQAKGQFIDLDLEVHAGDHGSTLRTRRRELVDLGLLRDSGGTRRPEGRARRFIIWTLTPKGAAVELRGA